MSRGHPEWDFQRVAYVFLRRALPHDAYVRSIDTAQKGSEIQRIKDKERGILAGQLDMEYLVTGFAPGKIELKVGDNKPTDQQLSTMAHWTRQGGYAFAAWTLDDIEAGLRAQGIPLRATAGNRWERHEERQAARAKAPKKKSRGIAERPNQRTLAVFQRARGAGVFG